MAHNLGPKVGAAEIDRKLHDLMKHDNPSFGQLGPEKELGSQFMNDFERHKRNFGKPNSLNKSMKMRLEVKGANKSKLYRTDGRVVIKE